MNEGEIGFQCEWEADGNRHRMRKTRKEPEGNPNGTRRQPEGNPKEKAVQNESELRIKRNKKEPAAFLKRLNY